MNEGLLAHAVRMVVSITSQGDITIKIPGDTGYIKLEGTNSFSYSEQWKILQNANIVAPNDIVYIGDGENDQYVDMYHVVIMDSYTTYSGQNPPTIDTPISDYIDAHESDKNPHTLYFVLLNSDEEMLETLMELYQH